MAYVPDGEQDFPKTKWRCSSQGLLPAVKFMVTNIRLTLTAISRGTCLFYSFLYILHCYDYLFHVVPKYDESKYYLKALIAHAVTNNIRLSYKIMYMKFDKKFFNVFFYEDSFQQLFYSFIFIYNYPVLRCATIGIDAIVLTPVILNSVLHFSGYLLSFFNALGFRLRPVINLLNLTVGRKAYLFVKLIDLLELCLKFPMAFYTTSCMFFGLPCMNSSSDYTRNSILLYDIYLALRCYSNNNQFGRLMRDTLYRALIRDIKHCYQQIELVALSMYRMLCSFVERRIPEVEL